MPTKASGYIKVFLIVLLAACTLADEVDPNYSYNDFMRQYNRTYTGEERAIHEQIFNRKYAELLKLRSQGHELAVNQFLDWTPEQEAAFFTFHPEQQNITLSSKPPVLSSGLFLSSTPSDFDWRNYDRVTSVKNQGGCGSCWAFSATAHYESLLAIATNGTKYDLAEQYALQCDTSSFGCRGGYPNAALKLFKNQGGIPLESTYPYNYSINYTDICNDTNRVQLSLNITGVYYYGSMSISQLQQDLYSYGPINVGVGASDPGFTGSTGMISCVTNPSINHAVLLVGYTKTHWIIKNSWGQNWGSAGYAYINKSADCGIRTYINEMIVSFNNTPSPSPPPIPDPTNSINLTVTMTDSYGDGWNQNILAIRQNNVIAGLFGGNFTKGYSTASINITVQGNVETQIVVYQYGINWKQIGFAVTAPNGTIIHQRFKGVDFPPGIIFSTFCPVGDCPTIPSVSYYVTLNDTYGDGWNGNTLAFKQDGIVIGTFNMKSGYTAGPYEFVFKKLSQVNITVYILGTWTREIGFVVRNAAGAVVFERYSGTPFYADTILGSFCPDCLNLSPVKIAEIEEKPVEEEEKQNVATIQLNKSYMIATYVLASIVLILGVALGLAVFKYAKVSKQVKSGQQKVSDDNPSAKSISSSVQVMKNI